MWEVSLTVYSSKIKRLRRIFKVIFFIFLMKCFLHRIKKFIFSIRLN